MQNQPLLLNESIRATIDRLTTPRHLPFHQQCEYTFTVKNATEMQAWILLQYSEGKVWRISKHPEHFVSKPKSALPEGTGFWLFFPALRGPTFWP